MQTAFETPWSPRALLWLQSLTMLWMTVECSVSLVGALQARSIALLAFGSDSFIELLSASIVLLHFLPGIRMNERHAARTCAVLLFLLCAVIVLSSLFCLIRHVSADTSIAGIIVTALALLLMPILATIKRRKARELRNDALAADAVQSATCAFLAGTTLLGLGANALFNITWIDSFAALVATPILLVEARRAWKGHVCGCC